MKAALTLIPLMPNEAEYGGFSTRGSRKAEEAIDPGAFTAHQLSASQRGALSLTAHTGRQEHR